MKKWMLVAGAAIVVMCGVGIWFWLLGSVSAEAPRGVTLDIQESNVQVRRPGTTLWENAATGMEIGEGWSVKTDANGVAVIRFGGQGESRLGNVTEVTVTKAMINAEDPTKVNILLKLGTGRIWSRVLKLFDIESSYAVETSAVVATVRGTAFDISSASDGSSELWVSQSAVDVAPSQGILLESPGAVAEGQSARYGSDGNLQATSTISEEVTSGPWFSWNTESDEAFVNDERERVKTMFLRMGGVGPDSVLYGISRASENLHLAFASDERKDALASRYFARRFARILNLVEEGKTGLAAQEFARIETHARTQLRGATMERERRSMRIAIARVNILVADAGPDSPLFPFKQRLENLLEALEEGNDAALLYVRMLGIDARLNEAARFRAARKFTDAATSLSVAESGIQNIARESESMLPSLPKEARRALRGKLAALIARGLAERHALRAAMTPALSDETATSTEDGTDAATSTLLGPPPSEPLREPPQTGSPGEGDSLQGPQYQSITLFIQPNPVNVGQAANLIVEAKTAAGAIADVTAKSTFVIVNGVGNLNGPTVTGSQQGTITVQASLNDNGTVRTSSATVTVQGQVTLTGLELSSSQGLLIDAYKNPTTQIIASAVYSNGYRKAVTAQTVYELPTPAAGSMNGSFFTAQLDYVGTALILGSFTEGGVTVTGDITLNIR